MKTKKAKQLKRLPEPVEKAMRLVIRGYVAVEPERAKVLRGARRGERATPKQLAALWDLQAIAENLHKATKQDAYETVGWLFRDLARVLYEPS